MHKRKASEKGDGCNMKRIIALLIAVLLCLSLAACSEAAETRQDPLEIHMKAANAEGSEQMRQQSIELVGPWHLDSIKNDLDAFADSMDLFPGYGDWGAGMEIRSNGQMSWYIGADGGSGTYTVDGDLLHAALVNYLDQKEMTIDFRLSVENGKAVLAMDDQRMTIYWAYGDREDSPAIGTDEGLEDVPYPGADVVEIVNLRGDGTTIYKLADGSYMDRMERRFAYNGTDTWIDEDGVAWNEAAKD